MRFLTVLWAALDPASEGSAYQRMPKEKLPKLSSYFSLKVGKKWAWR
jgi:hypothetical protein